MKLLFLICAAFSTYSAAVAQQRSTWNTITYTRLDGSQYVIHANSNLAFQITPPQKKDVVLADFPHENVAPVRLEYTSLTGRKTTFYESGKSFAGLQRSGGGANLPASQSGRVMYPHPAAQSFTVRVNKPASVTVRDVYGRVVGQQAITGGAAEISTAQFAPGVYFVELCETGGFRIVEKIVVGT